MARAAIPLNLKLNRRLAICLDILRQSCSPFSAMARPTLVAAVAAIAWRHVDAQLPITPQTWQVRLKLTSTTSVPDLPRHTRTFAAKHVHHHHALQQLWVYGPGTHRGVVGERMPGHLDLLLPHS